MVLMSPQDSIFHIVDLISTTLRKGSSILVAGSGVSRHLSNSLCQGLSLPFEYQHELSPEMRSSLEELPFGRILSHQLAQGFPVISLAEPDSTNPQICYNLMLPGSLLILVSSRNPSDGDLMWASIAKAKGGQIVSIMKSGASELKALSSIYLEIEAELETTICEEQTEICHQICRQLEKKLFP